MLPQRMNFRRLPRTSDGILPPDDLFTTLETGANFDKSNFLTTTGKDLNVGDLEDFDEENDFEPTRISLADVAYRGERWTGDADSGAAWGFVNPNGSLRGYAGLFETTDVGDPIAQTNVNYGGPLPIVYWRGQIEWNISSGNRRSSSRGMRRDFILKINEAAWGKTFQAHVRYTATGPNFANYLVLNGTYDTNGVMTGDVKFGHYAGVGDAGLYTFSQVGNTKRLHKCLWKPHKSVFN